MLIKKKIQLETHFVIMQCGFYSAINKRLTKFITH